MFDFKFGRFYFSKRILNPPPRVISTNVPLYIGCRVHLNRRNGTYTVRYYDQTHVTITCQAWKDRYERGEKSYFHEMIKRTEIKCLHGHDKFR